ncbi:bifunctional 3-(3-hydroxy-phenyl)propionate/3-hydroxycinnamic acid hydroxylase [Rhodoplanes sp. TEM]|uniref:Bifunctional 3-(3-hydroxy-phenyl)propionate/3-hydroxycinnamic acid hydroxylase n=1 Tax=Rhodoplanes tepidamans TaxID=200616 RepID=A0ABT5JH38_RHOTP|nr:MULTISPECIES: bifunctional 3-(3-hydroxy-phenyl)propionate/3-hydroxycinnamic acid hydroxylase [Rhodoplanes]MDC7788894.1 bifunctional 3-(3-hydroxy-phenyl)propionate/3-hydroxycinnamic acid hydroxylase [Rhodoplanes tepidamans]MDC7985601.1 bifunctional 3-(3-hydroxy-phenyl)propionate/3-hydroxycinnamic acid hydroxylase [Rhodoplanes sp. TEM]MDQ0358771.1 3-(3-hydroxy-phenyl)propionate hydroxylase [Rhodoplanes tepidamans]
MTLACDVAIVGAGPTGLTLANLLGRAGVSVVLVERNEGTVQEPRAVSIDDESLRTLQAAGLVDAVLHDVALDYGSRYFGPDGRRFLAVEPTARDYGFPRRNAFEQPRLEATLRTGLSRFPNVTPLFRHACESAVEDASGVTLTLRDPAGGPVELRARFVAACDGGRSQFRKIVGATMTGSTYRQRWLIVDLAATAERLRQTRVVCDPARPLITLPGPGGIRRYEFMLRDDEDDATATDPSFVRTLLAAHGPDADAPVVRRQVYVFHARIADSWNTARLFLAGDAAHLSPPFAGQGMNSGLRDAHNLAWKLAAVVKGELGADLLATYQVERAPHAWALIKLAVTMGRVMMPTSAVQGTLVRAGFRLAGLVPPVQAWFAEMRYKPKPFYREGLVAPEDDGLGLAGRMLPQPEIERPDRSRVRLDDLLGDGFALVATGAEAQAHLARLDGDLGLTRLRRLAVLPPDCNPYRGLPDVPVGRDVAGLLTGRLRGRDALLVVRPDRYVAAACTVGPGPGAAADAARRLALRLAALPGCGSR